jgi:uncharacterized protein
MRWRPGGDRSNIEDRRGQGGFGMGRGMGRGMGIGGTAILLVLSLLFGRNLFNDVGGGAPAATATEGGEVAVNESPEEANRREFVTFVLNETQDTWERLLPQYFQTPYQDARLVLFRQATQTGCGMGEAGMGPFYCPADQRVYIDMSFYDELQQRFGAPGDFAQAYVIAHEFGHHVQTVLGISDSVRSQQQANPDRANDLSVRMELQADCFAGVWAHSVWTEPGEGAVESITQEDVQEGLDAAAAVGDDRILEQSGRSVDPDLFTHGTSEQRMEWFMRGFREGSADACDTFNA